MKTKYRILLACSLLAFFGYAVVVAQVGLPDGKRLYDYSNNHFILPVGAPPPVSTASPGQGQGAITTSGDNAYIYLGGKWCKVTVVTPTPSATYTPTPTPTP